VYTENTWSVKGKHMVGKGKTHGR